MFFCSIINADALNQKCGYGQGVTWERAVADALRIAKKLDSKAEFDKQTNTITVSLGHSF